MGSLLFVFFSSRRRHTRCYRDWSSDVCSSDLFDNSFARPHHRWPVPSERVQRQIHLLLDEIEAARASGDWRLLRDQAHEILDLEPDHQDAVAFLAAAGRREQRLGDGAGALTVPSTQPDTPLEPTSFAAGRYEAIPFLGEG